MFYSVNTVTGKGPGDEERAESQLVGTIARIALKSDFYSKLPIAELLARLSAPSSLGQIRVFYNDFGQCVGFVTWAYLAPDVERRLLGAGQGTIESIEWNEGGSPWVMDFLAVHGTVEKVLKALRDEVFRDEESVTYCRYKNGRRIVKRLSRSDRTTFMRQAANRPPA